MLVEQECLGLVIVPSNKMDAPRVIFSLDRTDSHFLTQLESMVHVVRHGVS